MKNNSESEQMAADEKGRLSEMERIFTRRALPQRQGERGVTLIEILIVVAIMAIIAAVIIPNVSAFRTTGTLAAANDEASNVKTAVIAHYAREQSWPDTCDDLRDFLAGNLRATYDFRPEEGEDKDGFIHDADPNIANGWGSAIQWNRDKQLWERP